MISVVRATDVHARHRVREPIDDRAGAFASFRSQREDRFCDRVGEALAADGVTDEIQTGRTSFVESG
ncbi:MAG TPA: hypothetical protein VKU41_21755 [Polyangiaceae bacterium]|nr:hypothetical protein [Polyangiaceae bacterium]